MGSFPLLVQAKGFTESIRDFMVIVICLALFAIFFFIIWGVALFFNGSRRECVKKLKYSLYSFCIMSAFLFTAGLTGLFDENVNNDNSISTKKGITISTPEEDAKEIVKLFKEGHPMAEEILRKKTDLYLIERGEDEAHRFLDLATKFVTQ